MKRLSVSELRKHNDSELMDLLVESRRMQLKYRMQKATQSPNSVHLGIVERKKVARIKTILRERKFASEGVAQ